MAVSREQVEYIAALAKLKFSEEEIENFTNQFNEILKYMETLNEVDTSDVEPLNHPIEGSNFFRNDDLMKGSSPEEALKNAPETDGPFFKVPKIIKTDQSKS